MKRMIALLIALLLFAAPALGEVAVSRTGMNLSYDRIVEMAEYMKALVTGDYLDIKQVPEAQQTIAEGWASGIEGTPRLVVQLNINNASYLVETRAVYSQEDPWVIYEAESTAISEIWQYLVYYAANEAALTESDYSEIMTVNAHLGATMMYAEEGPAGNAVYIVLYENATPLFYVVNAENDAVSIQAMFLPSAKLAKCENYGQVALWLMLNGFTMTCEEIKAE